MTPDTNSIEAICFSLPDFFPSYNVGNKNTHLMHIHNVPQTSINELMDGRIKIYPTIVDRELSITGLPQATKINISVRNILGETVMKDYITGESEVTLETGAYTTGLYILTIEDGQNGFTRKFIKR